MLEIYILSFLVGFAFFLVVIASFGNVSDGLALFFSIFMASVIGFFIYEMAAKFYKKGKIEQIVKAKEEGIPILCKNYITEDPNIDLEKLLIMDTKRKQIFSIRDCIPLK